MIAIQSQTPHPPSERLWQVTTHVFCAGIVTHDDVVIDAAPILRWSIGKTRDELRAYFSRKGWRVAFVSSM